jgi:hypothetical protein
VSGVRHARSSASLVARIVASRPLRFDLPNRPPVRAASGLRRFGDALVIVQDDAHALARLVDGLVSPVAFGTGTPLDVVPKPVKPDLEACVVIGDGDDARFVAFGSGSTGARERAVVLDRLGRVHVRDGAALYAALRERTDFSGSELNVEGAIAVGDEVLLLQRGNGAPRGALRPLDATIALGQRELLAWLDGGALPRLGAAHAYELGVERGVRFGFTDATSWPTSFDPSRPSFVYVACAEDSPDTYADGVTVGARLGLVRGEVVVDTAILDADGRPTTAKIEGLELLAADRDTWTFAAVTDPDDATLAATHLELAVTGVAHAFDD